MFSHMLNASTIQYGDDKEDLGEGGHAGANRTGEEHVRACKAQSVGVRSEGIGLELQQTGEHRPVLLLRDVPQEAPVVLWDGPELLPEQTQLVQEPAKVHGDDDQGQVLGGREQNAKRQRAAHERREERPVHARKVLRQQDVPEANAEGAEPEHGQ